MVNRSRTTVLAALTSALLLPSISTAQHVAAVTGSTAPTVFVAPATVGAPAAIAPDSATGALTTARAVGLQRYVADSATAPMMTMKSSRSSSVTLMVFGLATLLVGTVVNGDTGTVIVLTGAGIGLVGLYRYLNQ